MVTYCPSLRMAGADLGKESYNLMFELVNLFTS